MYVDSGKNVSLEGVNIKHGEGGKVELLRRDKIDIEIKIEFRFAF
jgi:hypothetical protein